MRVAVFSVFVFLLLFGSGNNLYAYTKKMHKQESSSQNQKKVHHLKIKETSQDRLVLDNAEIELEEELVPAPGEKSTRGLLGEKLQTGRYGFINEWYTAVANALLFELPEQSLPVGQVLFKCAAPIYIFQRVLRI